MLKSAVLPAAIDDRWRPGEVRTLSRCVRRSYRLDLMASGQPCLLWVSGRDRPGVHALGALAGIPEEDDGPVVPVRLTLLGEPVPRAELLTDPRMSGAEILRMPAGSNPSWLSAGQFGAVLDRVEAARLGRWAP
ncbi:hypothetical protein [Blastococcus sp. PRF04-17]|uniref:hypothetical protein n=1 Tax=Blastococcus sp. PRF04-17 TaxID=2933797 RepID=UPI001FF1DC06|nr:hypothetical protein [Blastococcus sp. PRF04-17]UOY02723.1 hypothetical protein MVA48_04985 [Blastococcus sp. PRF04-17]